MADNDPEIYELFAVRYATHDRTQALNFVDPPDPHDAMPIDYFVWAAVSESRTFVIDTGFTAEAAKPRGRDHIRCPTEGLIECIPPRCDEKDPQKTRNDEGSRKSEYSPASDHPSHQVPRAFAGDFRPSPTIDPGAFAAGPGAA